MAEPLPVVVTRLQPVASYPVTRFYTGEVVATRRSDLGFERGSMVVAVAYDRGEQVVAGAVVARLDRQNLQAELAPLQAERLRAIAQLKELQTGTRPEVIAAQKATVAQITARMRNVEITIAKSILRAPFAGVVGERREDESRFAAAIVQTKGIAPVSLLQRLQSELGALQESQ